MKICRALAAVLFTTVAATQSAWAEPIVEVVPRAEVDFQPLNPLRGDASPKAGVLWGDIKKNVPSGAIIEFVDGFASPPHIHNITYRAVVISGMVHNDDPKAERMWMGPGSFWTQPAGETHITAAKEGARAVAFLEIFQGPYLVQPASQAFDNGERPVNVANSNIVWLEASDIAWLSSGASSASSTGAQVAFLWGNVNRNTQNGTFVKLAGGQSATLRGNDAWLRAVVIKGELTHTSSDGAKDLGPGSYFAGKGEAEHQMACKEGDECLIYVRTRGRYTLNS